MDGIIKITGFATLLFFSVQACASLVLQGTRIIFPSDKKAVGIQLTNYSEQATLTQSWVDEGNLDSTPETTNAPFIVTPPVTKIAANDGAQLQIRFIGDKLPTNKESVFYLNVLDIAPKPKQINSANMLQFAIQTRIKVFYRPIALINKPDDLINNIKFHLAKDGIIVNNPTPYFLSIANIYLANNESRSITKSSMIAPFSSQIFPSTAVINHGENITMIYIDDTGKQIQYQTKL
ncbi:MULTISPECIES: fimbrial biogenesis chaperone [Providencia]|uniref:fimbrial biogenesis chaperone n=1 Tax=Providencia TaxID=586 RepID=UPI000D6FFAF7|nr:MULTISPECIES: molecular chaperone [Providencia]ELR5297118.1 molecular chaperone [Providencia rettgeri]MBI6191905.1 molecular chaperone [Providencia rettgeri]MBQ0342987.1 molecular chaperone [Providencia rettgeri]MBQ0396759.1 molecular chaperone [Providencia rettgeri]MCG9941681.1 molecular chaperone [Providencia rettgeri]